MENLEPPSEVASHSQLSSREVLLAASSAYAPTAQDFAGAVSHVATPGGAEALAKSIFDTASSLYTGIKSHPVRAALYSAEAVAVGAAFYAIAPQLSGSVFKRGLTTGADAIAEGALAPAVKATSTRSIEAASLLGEKLPIIGKLPLHSEETIERVSKLTAQSVNGFSDRLTALMTEREDAVMVRHLRKQIERLGADTGSPYAQVERTRLLKIVDAELEQRRILVSGFVNRETKTMFSHAVVPELTVEFQSPTARNAASYGRGVVYLKREDLATVGRYYRSLNGDTLSSKLLHEVKHAEQNGLILRRSIDIATGGDTSGRALTKAELQKVKSVYEMSTNLATDEALIQDVNLKRAGRVLSPEDHGRAGVLSASNRELAKRGPIHLKDKDELAHLSDKFDQTFIGPDAVARQKLIGDEVELASKKVADNHIEYKNWAHEVEAWAITKQVDALVGKDQTLEQILAQCVPKE